ncbi:MAG: hypothetical protein LUG50_05010 [Planctomycetaceae bacterium]|nr:hypothetical protein [Planctomycetaceae bacterium]
MPDINQDDIDKMLQEMGGGGGADADPEPEAPEPAAEAAEVDMDLVGAASQDDIDALFAAVGTDGDTTPAPAAAAPEPVPEAPAPAPTPEPAAQAEDSLDGVASQDDIDALFSAVGTDPEPAPAAAPAPEPEPAAAPEPEAEDVSTDGVASQDDIDALFSSVGGEPEAEPEPEPVPEPEPEPEPEPAPEPEPEPEPTAEPEPVAEASPEDDVASLLDSVAADMDSADNGPDDLGDLDMEELLRQVSEAAPPPPPRPSPVANMDAAETAIISPDVSTALAQAGVSRIAETPAMPAPPPAAPAPEYPSPPMPPAAAAGTGPSGARREFSVLYGAGEVESVANQINALLNTMSEKAHSYMQAWIAADSEAKELRARAVTEERRRDSLAVEKEALARQLDEMRAKVNELEGIKIAGEESRRTLETSYQAQIRELESRVSLLTTETQTLKDELTRTQNTATGVDMESRRARFEVDRLKNEVESERMERLRIQRALENREKELQAMQAQSSGQASALFIDELHRLVRRLETELEARSSGAYEALKQLDRMEVPEHLVPAAANLRAGLMQALGQEHEAEDALKSLGREASGVKGPGAISPEKPEMVSFESALSTTASFRRWKSPAPSFGTPRRRRPP